MDAESPKDFTDAFKFGLDTAEDLRVAWKTFNGDVYEAAFDVKCLRSAYLVTFSDDFEVSRIFPSLGLVLMVNTTRLTAVRHVCRPLFRFPEASSVGEWDLFEVTVHVDSSYLKTLLSVFCLQQQYHACLTNYTVATCRVNVDNKRGTRGLALRRRLYSFIIFNGTGGLGMNLAYAVYSALTFTSGLDTSGIHDALEATVQGHVQPRLGQLLDSPALLIGVLSEGDDTGKF
ncbi:hypothetical protein BDZ89DRAFT_1041553 [Hymenopellis radicata]|nr:hypothetical protein BDZ89DRAFT_1041553 [Hymenopellis radicata]